MFYSKELTDYILTDKCKLGIEIKRKSENVLTKENLIFYPEKFRHEISEFYSIKHIVSKQSFENLIGEIVLIEIPDSSCWAHYYHLEFFKILNVYFENDECMVHGCNMFYVASKESFEKQNLSHDFTVHLPLTYFQTMHPTFRNIFVPKQMFLKKLSNLEKIEDDPYFLQYKYNPETIAKQQLASEIFSKFNANSFKL